MRNDTEDNAVTDPFADPVAYLANLGIDAVLVAVLDARLPEAA